MKVKLSIAKNGTTLYESVYDVIDEESFAAAFADVWREMHRRRLAATTSVGELMEIINDELIDELSGAQIKLERAGGALG